MTFVSLWELLCDPGLCTQPTYHSAYRYSVCIFVQCTGTAAAVPGNERCIYIRMYDTTGVEPWRPAWHGKIQNTKYTYTHTKHVQVQYVPWNRVPGTSTFVVLLYWLLYLYIYPSSIKPGSTLINYLVLCYNTHVRLESGECTSRCPRPCGSEKNKQCHLYRYPDVYINTGTITGVGCSGTFRFKERHWSKKYHQYRNRVYFCQRRRQVCSPFST